MDTEAAPTPESQDATTTPSNASTADSAEKNRPSDQDVSDGDSQGAAAAKSRHTWLLFAKDLETVGLAIFSLTSVATILFVIIFNFVYQEPLDLYPSLRSTDILMKLAATGLVVALIGRARQNAFVLAFGVFLIAGREEFIDDLRYLRSEGLLSFAYEDLDKLTITEFGHTVLRDPETGRRVLGGPERDPAAGRETVCDAAPLASAELLSRQGLLINVGTDQRFLRFTVTEDDYQIDIRKDSDDSPVDPTATLFSVTPCEEIEYNDDAGGELDSQIIRDLVEGDYVIGVGSLNYGGAVRVSVQRVAEVRRGDVGGR